MEDSLENKKIAKFFLSKGVSIIPLSPFSKKPLIKWEEYQKRLATEREVEGWFSDPMVGMAAICGRVSGGLVVQDFENEEDFKQFYNEEKILSATLVIKTPHGGRHVYLREEGEVPKRAIRIAKDPPLDLLGEGGYAVLFPTQIDHAKCDKSKCKMEGVSKYEVVSSTIEIMAVKGVYESTLRRCKELGWKVSEAKPSIDDILHGVPEGMRNNSAFHYCRYLLFKLCLDPPAALAVLKRWNSLNNPPLQDSELESVWKSAQRYPFKIDEEPNKKYFKDGRFVPQRLAKELMNEFRFITFKDTGAICVYKDGVYHQYGEVLIREECGKRLGEEYKKTRAEEVIEFIKVSTYVERREEPPHLIPLKNGVFDLKSCQLLPHSPDFMFFNNINVKYDPDASCPNIEKFLKEVTASSEDVELLYEVIAFCLYREYFIAKALMLVGEGSNGKSTFLNLIKTFLGKENTAGRSLHELENNRFAKADLHHKLANIYADLPNKALATTGTFKMLTGRDLIHAEHKFQQGFTFENYAKLLFSANRVPEVHDDSDAFFRRWLILVFPKQFINEKADPHLLEKLTTEEELSGLLNKALTALKRLLERGCFTSSKTVDSIREDYKRKSSPVAAFVFDCLETDVDSFIIKKDLFNVFSEYCRANNLPIVSQDTFFRRLPAYVTVAEYRPKVGGGNERAHALKGIRFKADVPSVSPLSRVFYTLGDLRDDCYEGEEIGDGILKVRINKKENDDSVLSSTVRGGKDTVDTTATALKECNKAPPNSNSTERCFSCASWQTDRKLCLERGVVSESSSSCSKWQPRVRGEEQGDTQLQKNTDSSLGENKIFKCACGCGPWSTKKLALEHLELCKNEQNHKLEVVKDEHASG